MPTQVPTQYELLQTVTDALAGHVDYYTDEDRHEARVEVLELLTPKIKRAVLADLADADPDGDVLGDNELNFIRSVLGV